MDANYDISEVRARALRALIPPPRLRLSEWIEGNISLARGRVGIAGAGALMAVAARDR